MHQDALWLSITDEARRAVAHDAACTAMLSNAVLNQPGLQQAIIRQIAARLGAEFEAVAREAFASDPALCDAAGQDLDGIVRRDPASAGFLPVLLHFKGFLAVQVWRVSRWLWQQDRKDAALLLQSASSALLDVSIHPSAILGTSVFLDHGTGIVIGPFSIIGDDATIMQGVTVGRTADGVDDAPRIGRGVLLSSGATILGRVGIGDFARIGAGAVVDRDVPEGCTAVGIPARLTNCPDSRSAA